jgi:hypothetical protein
VFDPELIWRAPWHDLYAFFAAGNPPLAFQLLALNTVFFVIYCFRVARAKHAVRSGAAYAVQFLLMGANAMLMFQNQFNISTEFLQGMGENVHMLVKGLTG